jgi:putative pyruvate formate lyase activating enzyme
MYQFTPGYLNSYRTGKLSAKISEARHILKSCTLCPRQCFVNRLADETGHCNTGKNAVVACFNPHFGEEKPLAGLGGSGTIFFSSCSLRCNFCQNYDISHWKHGDEVSQTGLAKLMLTLQSLGCHNINFVTPTHVVPQILAAMPDAIERGLNIPLIYNSSGYDSVETLRLLNGIIDIYMPDFKFWSSKIAKETCNAPDYPEVARGAIAEMFHQVGDLVIEGGLARKGLLVRHLVLPNNRANTKEITRFLAEKISKNTYLNIMGQYHPCGTAGEVTEFSRRITASEFIKAIEAAKKAGLIRFDR